MPTPTFPPPRPFDPPPPGARRGTPWHLALLPAVIALLAGALAPAAGAATHAPAKHHTTCHPRKATKDHKAVHCPKKKKPAPRPTASSAFKVVFDDGANLFAVDGKGGGRRQLTTGGGQGANQYIEPSLSANGTRMVLQGPDSQLYTADGDGGHLHALTDGSMPTMLPQISADGSQLLWVTDFLMFAGPAITNRIAAFDGSGEQDHDLAHGIAGFAPGGRVLCDVTGTANQLFVGRPADLAADHCPTVVADASSDPNALFGERPHFSPDGKLVADDLSDDNSITSKGIFLYDVATGAQRAQLTTGDDTDPIFTPDGTRILFDRGNDIYSVPVAGGAATRFVANGQHPAVSR